MQIHKYLTSLESSKNVLVPLGIAPIFQAVALYNGFAVHAGALTENNEMCFYL